MPLLGSLALDSEAAEVALDIAVLISAPGTHLVSRLENKYDDIGAYRAHQLLWPFRALQFYYKSV